MTRIAIVAPIESDPWSGNNVTAARWGARLAELGYAVDLVPIDEGFRSETITALDNADLLVAFQARHTANTVESWRKQHPDRPVVVGLAGADLYSDMPSDPATMANVAGADALVVLQPEAIERLHAFEPAWADKAHVVHRSVDRPLPSRQIPFDEFRVVVLAHLQSTNDPLLAARAASLVPPNSRVTVHHGGRATDDDWLLQASAEATSNARYVWHGELNQPAARELLASAHVLACTSLSKSGANVVTEAIAMGIPVIGTRIDAHVGLLGSDHPGLFPVGDHLALATMLDWLELSPKAVADLAQRSIERQHLTDPATEREALDQLLRSLTS